MLVHSEHTHLSRAIPLDRVASCIFPFDREPNFSSEAMGYPDGCLDTVRSPRFSSMVLRRVVTHPCRVVGLP